MEPLCFTHKGFVAPVALSLFEVELISTLAEDLRVLLFPPRLTPAPGTIGDTLNSRRALHQEDGFREEEEERLRNARPAKERKRERGGGKGTAFSTVKEKERFFFPFLLSAANNGRKVSIFPAHRLSVIFHEKRNVLAKRRL